MSAIESRTTPPLWPCKGRSDARRESADAEGSEILRLGHALGVSERQIALTTGLSRSTVGEYLRRAAVIGITWPVPEGVDDAELERRLFTPPTFDEKPARPLPDCPTSTRS